MEAARTSMHEDWGAGSEGEGHQGANGPLRTDPASVLSPAVTLTAGEPSDPRGEGQPRASFSLRVSVPVRTQPSLSGRNYDKRIQKGDRESSF